GTGSAPINWLHGPMHPWSKTVRPRPAGPRDDGGDRIGNMSHGIWHGPPPTPRDAATMAAAPLRSPAAVPPARQILLSPFRPLLAQQPVRRRAGHSVQRGRPPAYRHDADSVRRSPAHRRADLEGPSARPQGPRTQRLCRSFLQFQVLRLLQIVEPRSRPLRPVPWQVARAFASRRRGTVRLDQSRSLRRRSSAPKACLPGWHTRYRLCWFWPFPPLPQGSERPLRPVPRDHAGGRGWEVAVNEALTMRCFQFDETRDHVAVALAGTPRMAP